MPVYKISCEFYVRADNEDDVEIAMGEDEDFVESHLIIEKATEKVAKEDIFEDLS